MQIDEIKYGTHIIDRGPNQQNIEHTAFPILPFTGGKIDE
jgi:hypothetical protein